MKQVERLSERDGGGRRQKAGDSELESGPVKVPIEEHRGEINCCELGREGRGQGHQGPKAPTGIR